MVKAMNQGDFEHLGCFAFTLQLVIHNEIFSQRAVTDTLTVCQQIVRYFKHSPLSHYQYQLLFMQTHDMALYHASMKICHARYTKI